MKIFSGNATLSLAKDIAKYLNKKLGIAEVTKFSDGEISVNINENVRGHDVFIIQSTCYPVNDNIMELIIIIDALKRASAKRITAVIPYFGYARQDRRIKSYRVPITAKVIASCLSNVGVNRVLTVDLHSEQIQGFFDIPIDNVFTSPVIAKDIKKNIKIKKPVLVSPDIGSIVRTRTIAELLNSNDIAIIDKRRSKNNESQVMNIIGKVKKRNCILIDDIIDTAGTLCNAANMLKKKGAKKIFSYSTHPVFSGKADYNLKNSFIDEIIVCDTIPLSKKIKNIKKVRTIKLSKMLSEAIRRINKEKSISEMFLI
ncbi:ribose-phosphate pyrophosphokinase [Buchnera aphidicola (Ceratoglyphina bambusae)]|uniref:ribose-phosphate pyrophosphokinase n=1 Tax=Buchnera aphidicola TaxID=9 RepID=UPI0031B7F4BB